MTKRRMLKMTVTVALLLALSVILSCSVVAVEELGECEECHLDIVNNFTTSIHYLGRDSPEEWVGGANIGHFGIDLDEFKSVEDCSRCHSVTCENCHEGEGGHGSEVTIGTCGNCHHKEIWFTGTTSMGEGQSTDIHYDKGLICTDCHVLQEMHGDGTVSDTPLRTSRECEDCHMNSGKTVKGMNVTQYSPDTSSHKVHDDRLDCTSCHAGYLPTCGNCHLSSNEDENFKANKFCLAKDIDGEIKPFLRTSSIYNNETQTSWVWWMPHTTTDKAKDCAFCHENPDILCYGDESNIIGDGGSFLPEDTMLQSYLDAYYAEESTATPTESVDDAQEPTEEPTPGFEAVFSISGILAVAYLIRRYKK